MWKIMLEVLCVVMSIAVVVGWVLMVKSITDLNKAEKRFKELFDEEINYN